MPSNTCQLTLSCMFHLVGITNVCYPIKICYTLLNVLFFEKTILIALVLVVKYEKMYLYFNRVTTMIGNRHTDEQRT